MKKIDQAIHDIRARLAWPVREETGESPEFQIVSYPERREHVISWPRPDAPAGPPRQIEMLHELVHALLAEQVHHEFSGHLFKRGTSDDDIRIVSWACRAAADWFVDGQLMSLVPEEEKAEIEEHFGLVARVFTSGRAPHGDVFFLLSAGLMIAQAVKFLGTKVETGGSLAGVVQAFLEIPPEHPTIESLLSLMNRLLAVYCNRRVRLVQDGNLEVLEICVGGGD